MQTVSNNPRRRKALLGYYSSPQICETCGEIIHVREGERPSVTRKKRFCGSSCAAKSNNLGVCRKEKRPLPSCLVCGKIVKRSVAKYCSHKCQLEAAYLEYIKKWLDGERSGNTKPQGKITLSAHVHRWLRETRGNSCEQCGWAEIHPHTGKVPLQVDHIDGDAENSRAENLRLLCPNCHSLTPTYGSLNKGNGKRLRKD